MAIETLMGLARGAGHDLAVVRPVAPAAVPKAKAGTAPYDSAATGRRAQGWNATKLGPNAVNYGTVDTIRDRARDAVRKNPYAANAVATYISEAVGSGIKPQSMHPDPDVRKAINAEWARFADTAEFSGKLDFYGLQCLAWRAWFESGEVFTRFRLRNKTKMARMRLVIPFQLQLMESDQIPTFIANYDATPAGNTVREGIEFDPDGDRVAYHCYREHPNDSFFFANAWDILRVPEQEIIHLFQPLRPGQFRGVPWMSSVLVKLYDLDGYDDAELMRKKTVAMFAAFIKKTTPEDQPFNESNPDASDSTGQSAVFSLEPGTMQVLLPNEDVTFSTPPTDGNYSDFMRTQLRAVAAGMNCTYEQLTGDLTGVNFSSIRTGLLQFRRKCEQLQYLVFCHQFNGPVWRRFLKEAVLAARLDLPGYASDPYPYEAVRWVTPGWPWVDPLKDVQAEVMAIRSGLDSRSRAVAQRGEDAEQIDQEQMLDNERADEAGLTYDTDGRKILAAREALTAQPVAKPGPKQTNDAEQVEDEDAEGDDD